MLKPLKIGNVILRNNLILAPLAGYTDAGMRLLCHEAGAGLTITEMVSVKALLYKNINTLDLLIKDKKEYPVAVQLFGSDPEAFFEVIRNDENLSPFDIIDINMGCPVKKIVSSGDGSALLENVKKATSIVEKSASATNKPITVKIRIPKNYYTAGEVYNEKNLDKNPLFLFASALYNSGAKMIAIHGRTRAMMYGGKADWDSIDLVAKNLKIPIIGNGDILSQKDIIKRLSTSVSGVMIGRGAIGNPSIFSFSSPDTLLPSKKINETIRKHIHYSLNFYGERYTVLNMRKHLAYYVRGIKNMREFKSNLNNSKSIKELLSLIDAYIFD